MNYFLNIKDNQVIVSSTSYHNPMHELSTLAGELHDNHFSGDVLFDLLCTNGDSSNRFIKLSFDGDKFDPTSAVVIKPEKSLLDKQEIFYLNHHLFIANSVLSSRAQANYLS